MLVIRSAQMGVLARDLHRRFCRSMEPIMRDRFPLECACLSADELQAWIEYAAAAATRAEIHGARDVQEVIIALLTAWLIFGRGREPESFRRILGCSLPADARVAMVQAEARRASFSAAVRKTGEQSRQ